MVLTFLYGAEMENRLIYATAKIKDKRMSITTVPNKHLTFKLPFRLPVIFFQWTLRTVRLNAGCT
jgi:hypothetical protein